MIRVRPLFLAPPLVFVLAALVAWLTAAPSETSSEQTHSAFRTKRQRNPEPMVAGSAEVVAQFEQEMLRPPLPPAEVLDADWMEDMIARQKAFQSSHFIGCGGGGAEYRSTQRWAREDPEAMFAWLIHVGGSPEKDRIQYASTLFEEWVKTDMQAALAAATRIPSDLLRQEALTRCLEQLAVNDPAKARGLLLENLELFAMAESPSIFGGNATCDLLLTLPASEARTRLLAESLGCMTRGTSDETQTAALVWGNNSEDFRRELVSAGFKCGKNDAARFVGLEPLLRAHAESTGKREDADKFIEVCGLPWAARDFPAALEWTQAHLKGANRVDQSVALFGQAAGQNFDAAAVAWQQLPQGILKARAAGEILKSAPADRKADAESLVQSLSAHDQKRAR